jgi:D-alanyl-D-alanine carboxypeptidase
MLDDGKKELPPERYDARLFQQAYKAGLKAKELDKQNAKKDKIKKYLLYSLSIPVVILAFVFLKPKPKENYLLTNQSFRYEEIIPYPEVQNNLSVKGVIDVSISAKSGVAVNVKTNQYIFEKRIDDQIYPASLTKLVTAMVMIDIYGLDYDLEITKDIPEDYNWSLGLQKGDVIKTDELLKAMIISSYNDAAYVLANEFGYDDYVGLMNKKLLELGCKDSHFTNPTGLHEDNHYSTIRDLSKIMNAVLKYSSILQVGESLGAEIVWISDDNIESQYIYTTNQLLGSNPFVKGLKTGYTDEAGQCLITRYIKHNQEYYIVIVGSEDRFGDTQKILNNL